MRRNVLCGYYVKYGERVRSVSTLSRTGYGLVHRVVETIRVAERSVYCAEAPLKCVSLRGETGVKYGLTEAVDVKSRVRGCVDRLECALNQVCSIPRRQCNVVRQS